jgi:hypothetical protein
MNRKKYKVSQSDYELFQKQYLMDTIRDAENCKRFGESFLLKFPTVVHQYVSLGGDYGVAEVEKLWFETDIKKAKQIIAFWIE